MENHYADLKSKKFFPSLVEYMISGPVCAMIWEGDNAVATGRDLCIDVGRNIIHGSDAVESANHEIGLWFPEVGGINNWTHHSKAWIYE